MGDPGAAQGEHDEKECIERRVIERRLIELLEPNAGRRPYDQNRVPAGTSYPGHEHVRACDAGTLGQQGHVCLVLDLLDPRKRESRARVPIEEEAAGLGEELGVRGVTSVQRDRDGPTVEVGAAVARHPPDLMRCRRQCAHRHPEIPQHHRELWTRRQAQG